MYEEFYDVEGQKKRAALIRRLLIENHVKDINTDGTLNGEKWLYGGSDPEKGGFTEWFYFCQGLWNEDASYAKITENISKHFAPMNTFGTFEPFFCCMELIRNRASLTETLIDKFEKYALKYMDIYMMDDSDLIGVNDNTPILMIAGLILGGEYFNNSKWLKVGHERLNKLKKLLLRRGFLSEYNSLTYTPLSIYGLAAIVNYSQNEEYRVLALECETELWKQLASLYMPSVSQTSGPYARAYPQDKLCYSYSMRTLMYILLGDKCSVNPINTIFAGDNDENYYWQISAAHIGNMLYHCPKSIAEEMLCKKYPIIVRGSAEVSASADTHMLAPLGKGYLSRENLYRTDFKELNEQNFIDEYSAGTVNIYSYQEKDFSIGTATKDFHNGVQSDNFMLIHSKSETPTSQNEIGTVFANYIVNDSAYERDDYGRKVAFQHEKTAMVLYRPKWYKGGVKKAGLSIVFSNANLINAVKYDGYIVDKFPYKNKELLPLFCDIGNLYIMIIPMICDKDMEEASVEISRESGNLILTLYNYMDKEIQFNKKEFCIKTNGFVCEVRRKSEYGSFDEFIKEISKFKLTDKLRCNIHTRYAIEREVCYVGQNVKLECCIGVLTDSIKYMTVNDELYTETKFLIEERGKSYDGRSFK